MNKELSVNAIFREYKDAYISQSGNFISHDQMKVLNSIAACRTGQLGYRIQKCDCCGHEFTLENSCRNRHCPLCQNLKREKWLFARKSELLPCKYFHIIFTIPHSLNDLILNNQASLYSLFFKTASDTLKYFAAKPHRLGADIGFLMILHTWGQQLLFHPHIHCLVTAGGLSKDKSKWINSRSDKFLFCVKKLSTAFNKNFREALLTKFNDVSDPLFFNSKTEHLRNSDSFRNFILDLKYKKWVVFCRAPLNEDYSVIDYLGRYAYRVAIANSRITKNENRKISFEYKDYRDDQEKTMELKVFEFIRRFLLHSLPDGFQKIRYYGILGNNQKKITLPLCRKFLMKEFDAVQSVFDHINAQEKSLELALNFFKDNQDFNKCQACKKGALHTTLIFLPIRYGHFKRIKTKYFDLLNTSLKSGP